MGLSPLLVHVLICYMIIVDKDIDLKLNMFSCLINYGIVISYKLTRLFWPNTCLVSMCIIGARGAVNKQV
jgi:hypothetical protein